MPNTRGRTRPGRCHEHQDAASPAAWCSASRAGRLLVTARAWFEDQRCVSSTSGAVSSAASLGSMPSSRDASRLVVEPAPAPAPQIQSPTPPPTPPVAIFGASISPSSANPHHPTVAFRVRCTESCVGTVDYLAIAVRNHRNIQIQSLNFRQRVRPHKDRRLTPSSDPSRAGAHARCRSQRRRRGPAQASGRATSTAWCPRPTLTQAAGTG